MQGVFIVGKKGESGVYGKATKGTTKGETNTSCKGKSAKKKVEEGRREEAGARGQATRSIARMKEEFSRRIEKKSR